MCLHSVRKLWGSPSFLLPFPRPGVGPDLRVVSMDSDDISIAAVERARHVQRLGTHLGHEQALGKRLGLRVFLDNVARGDYMLRVGVCDIALPHALFGMRGDHVAVLLDR